MEVESKDIAIYLEPDEKLLWWGKPKVEYLMKYSEMGIKLLIYLSLVTWAIISMLFEKPEKLSTQIYTGLNMIWLFFGPIFHSFFIEPKMLRNTTYGLTNQRILIVNNSKREKLKTFSLEEIIKTKCDVKKNGIGNIEFRRYSRLMIFQYLENVEQVYQQVQDITEIKTQ